MSFSNFRLSQLFFDMYRKSEALTNAGFTPSILDMSRHFGRWEKKCRNLICFITIDTSCIYRGQFLAPYDTFDNRYLPYRVTFQTVHTKNHVGAKYSHGCSMWTRHYAWFTPVTVTIRCCFGWTVYKMTGYGTQRYSKCGQSAIRRYKYVTV